MTQLFWFLVFYEISVQFLIRSTLIRFTKFLFEFFLKISHNSLENTCAGVCFLIKLQAVKLLTLKSLEEGGRRGRSIFPEKFSKSFRRYEDFLRQYKRFLPIFRIFWHLLVVKKLLTSANSRWCQQFFSLHLP